jgi:hypothetical protein
MIITKILLFILMNKWSWVAHAHGWDAFPAYWDTFIYNYSYLLPMILGL